MFVYARRNTHRFYWSEINDARTIKGDGYSSAESAPDNLRDLLAVGDNLFLLGKETIEVHYLDKADVNLRFKRINQRTITKGVIGTGAAVLFDNALHFVGHDCIVYRMAEVPMQISNPGLEERIAQSAHFRLFTFFWQGHAFLCLRLDGGTWVFDPAGGSEWPRFDTFDLGNFIGQCATTPETGVVFGSAYGRYLYEFGDDWTDDGRMLERRWTGFFPIKADAVAGRRDRGRVRQRLDRRVRLAGGQSAGRGEILTRWRQDLLACGAPPALGREGNYRWRPRWRSFGFFDAPGAFFDFRMMDPTPLRVSAVLINESASGRARYAA